MALTHARPGEAVDVAPFGAQLAHRQSVALFKSTDLEVIRTVLAQGAVLPQHTLPGEITIQCVEGLLEVVLNGRPTRLAPQQLLFVPSGQLHAVTALAPSSALITFALRR